MVNVRNMEVFKKTLLHIFYTKRVKVDAIPCPHQLLTRGGNRVLMAKAVLSTLAPPEALATGQGIAFRYRRINLCDSLHFFFFFTTAGQIFQHCVQ